jgi:hypothetical protein
MEEDGLMFGGRGCFVDVYFAVFRREILTVDV